jgi:hypothetical protein
MTLRGAFNECDADGSGILTGPELGQAVQRVLDLPAPEKTPAHEGALFSENDRTMLELQKSFLYLFHIGGEHLGVPKRLMPLFARFCMA